MVTDPYLVKVASTPVQVLKRTDDYSLIQILPTPFGTVKDLDLHGQYFNDITYFGDDRIQAKMSFYEHGLNDLSNPEMAKMVEKDRTAMLLGTSRLVKTDGAGRWFEIEVARSLAYHDDLMRLIDMGIMGASTQAYRNTVELGPDGKHITVWLENENGPTPTPASPKTIGRIYEAMKGLTVLPAFHYFKDGQAHDLDETYVQQVEASGAQAEVEATDFVAEVDALLNGDEKVAATTPGSGLLTGLSPEVRTALSEIVNNEVKAQMSVFIELWGANPEEAREAIMQMLGTAKAVNDLRTGQTALQQTLLLFAKYMRESKKHGSEVGEEFVRMSQIERDLLREAEFEKQKNRPGRLGSRVPPGSPGTN